MSSSDFLSELYTQMPQGSLDNDREEPEDEIRQLEETLEVCRRMCMNLESIITQGMPTMPASSDALGPSKIPRSTVKIWTSGCIQMPASSRHCFANLLVFVLVAFDV